ncbi:SDR family oxidoreductase [Kribbella sp. NPDC051620]|uniref:SDR family oxidoreductase n=1 Tax=Kribbella sp. NPDC051620 TaxID=3364120 RepID=UPI0037AA187E
MILVAGGTGTLGTEVVRLLTTRGEQVRVLTRDPARAAHLSAGVGTVVGDLRNPDTAAIAVDGCRTVVSAVQGFAGPGKVSPESVDRDANRNLIRAAVAAGVEHVVLMSVHGCAADHPMSLFRAKYAAEQELLASGLEWTIIRPTAYLETWSGIVGAGLERGKVQVFGPGRNPINFVSAHDVAALVHLAVSDASLRKQTYEVAGPENLTFSQLADRLVAASGRPARIQHIPLPMLRAMALLARPISPAFARQAQAAVVMNSIDLTATPDPQLPIVPTTTLTDILA